MTKIITKSDKGLYHNPHINEINDSLARQPREQTIYTVTVDLVVDSFIERRHAEILSTFKKAGWNVRADVRNSNTFRKRVKYIFT